MRIFDDTGAEVERVYIKLMSQLPVWKKIKIIDDLYLTGVSMATSSVHRQYSGINQSDVKKKVAEMFLGKDLSRKIYDVNAA